MSVDIAMNRLLRLGFAEADARTLADHFAYADERGRPGHGASRIAWLETFPDLQPDARPERVVVEPGFERWEGRGALGYLTLAAVVDAQLESPPERARVIVAADAFPTGVLGYWVRRLADGGLASWLTTTSPPRLASPDGGPPLAGTNPIAIGVPSSDGQPLVSDVSMGAVTHGDVLLGKAAPEELVPFGGEQAHKSFALAVGLQALVDALGVGTYGALLVVAQPGEDPVPALRRTGVRLPGG